MENRVLEGKTLTRGITRRNELFTGHLSSALLQILTMKTSDFCKISTPYKKKYK